MTYEKTKWVDNSSPDIDTTNLNHIETGIDEAHDAIDDTTTGHDHDGTDSKKVIAGNVTNTPAGSISATDTQAAITELDTEKLAKASNLSDVASAATSFGNIKQTATESATGVLEKATTAEVVTGTDTDRAVTPAGVTARMGAPGEIGGTTPAAGSFTTGIFSGIVSLANNVWLRAKNYAGTDYINMFKVNVDDEIDVGCTIKLGPIEADEDSGAIVLFDMPVSTAPADGDEESASLEIDGDIILKIYAEADGAGGVDTHQVQPLRPMVYAQAPQVLSGAGAVDIVSQITHIVTTGADALTLVDGAEGQEKFIVMKTDANDGTLTPDNLGNGSTITFDDVGDSAHLIFTNGAWHWFGGTATLA